MKVDVNAVTGTRDMFKKPGHRIGVKAPSRSRRPFHTRASDAVPHK